MSSMLSNFLITNQRFVLIIDDRHGQEKIAQQFMCQMLREQGQDPELTIKILPGGSALKQVETLNHFVRECETAKVEHKWNIIVPPLSDLLCYLRPHTIFHLLQRIQKCQLVKRLMLWVSTSSIMHSHAAYIIDGFGHMADLVLHLESQTELTLLTRKQGSAVTRNRYSYETNGTEFLVRPIGTAVQNKLEEKSAVIESNTGTFKIELDEDEMVARNALKLPYEKTSELPDGNIIYSADANDGFDDEDPDEDLCI